LKNHPCHAAQAAPRKLRCPVGNGEWGIISSRLRHVMSAQKSKALAYIGGYHKSVLLVWVVSAVSCR
jgi:hypothetical protein